MLLRLITTKVHRLAKPLVDICVFRNPIIIDLQFLKIFRYPFSLSGSVFICFRCVARRCSEMLRDQPCVGKCLGFLCRIVSAPSLVFLNLA